MGTLSGRVAVVTGASQGIGRAIALRLAREGARTVLSARNQEALERAVAEIRSGGGEAAYLPLDLRLPDAPGQLADFAVRTFGGIAIVVNNAGATRRGEFSALTDQDWDDGFALKFFGAVRLTRAAWPHLSAAAGSLIHIAGSGGRTPGSQFTIGGSVNAALLSFTKAMADTGLRDGVQVNAINPGTIRTARFQTRLAALAAERGLDLEAAERMFIAEERIARIGEPDDIAGMVAFLAGPAGRQFHGALLDMDAGATRTI